MHKIDLVWWLLVVNINLFNNSQICGPGSFNDHEDLSKGDSGDYVVHASVYLIRQN